MSPAAFQACHWLFHFVKLHLRPKSSFKVWVQVTSCIFSLFHLHVQFDQQSQIVLSHLSTISVGCISTSSILIISSKWARASSQARRRGNGIPSMADKHNNAPTTWKLISTLRSSENRKMFIYISAAPAEKYYKMGIWWYEKVNLSSVLHINICWQWNKYLEIIKG